MILTYHQAIELMSYLPMALPALKTEAVNQPATARLEYDQSDLELMVWDADMADEEMVAPEMRYVRKTA